MIAIDQGYPLSVIQYLVEKGADVNTIVMEGAPLIFAALRKTTEDKLAIVVYLICQGADYHYALHMANVYKANAEKEFRGAEASKKWLETSQELESFIKQASEDVQKGACDHLERFYVTDDNYHKQSGPFGTAR